MHTRKRIRSIILRRFFLKMLRAALLCIAVLIACLLVGKSLLGAYTWYGTEGFYPLLHWISENQGIFVAFLFLAGLLGIGVFYWITLLNYFQEVIDAMEALARDEGLIQLRPQLREVEQYMNEVQIQIRRNEQLAKEAEQRKNDLVVYLAHDLKTPLTSVIGYLSLMDEAPDMPASQRAKYVHITLDKALRLEKLINEFFEITRYNLQTIALEKETVNLSFMLEQMTDEFYPLLSDHGNTIRLEVEPDASGGPLTLYADGEKLARVFNNILKNAIAYSYPGTAIAVECRTVGDFVRIEVSNRGRTIPPHKLEAIFEKFFRLDDARATNTGGAGLGLAIAKEIVTLHDGSITAASEDEVTSFLVELPLPAKTITASRRAPGNTLPSAQSTALK